PRSPGPDAATPKIGASLAGRRLSLRAIVRRRRKASTLMSTQDARIESVQTGAGVNSWIIGDDDEVIVIDPGTDAAAVLGAVGDREVLAVICTHGHEGHCGAALEVAGRDEAPVALHPGDRRA